MKNKDCTLLIHTAHTLEWLKKEGSITDITFDIETKLIKESFEDKIKDLEDELYSYKSALSRMEILIKQNSIPC